MPHRKCSFKYSLTAHRLSNYTIAYFWLKYNKKPQSLPIATFSQKALTESLEYFLFFFYHELECIGTQISIPPLQVCEATAFISK